MDELVTAAQELLEFIEGNNVCDETDYHNEEGDDIVHFDEYRSTEFEDTINKLKQAICISKQPQLQNGHGSSNRDTNPNKRRYEKWK